MQDHHLKKSGLYYPIFRNLETEIIELSNGIYFSDEQVSVYSVKISELLSRCLSEIESLYTDLYREDNGSNPSSIGDAWRYLDRKLELSNKALKVTSDNFYFEQSFYPDFTPFSYTNGSAEDFYAAYNAVKHHRAKNLHKANIGLLIRALGALYILNVYYADNILKSAVFEPLSAGLAVGVFLNLGVDLSSHMKKCLIIDFYDFDYFTWQDGYSAEYKGIIESLPPSTQAELVDRIIETPHNVLAIANQLLILHNSQITMGEVFEETYHKVHPLTEGSTATIINKGYRSVYFTEAQRKMPMRHFSAEDRIALLDYMDRPFTKNKLRDRTSKY